MTSTEAKPWDDGLAAIMNATNSKYAQALEVMDKLPGLWPLEYRIPTGSINLDLDIGMGGFPRGRVSQVIGMESSGKSTLMANTMIQVQEIFQQPSVFIDTEYSFNTTYLNRMGLDTDGVLVAHPSDLEEAINITYDVIMSGKTPLVVFDSVAGIKAKDVMDGEADKETRALEARRWGANIAKLARAAWTTKTSLVLLNQKRAGMPKPGQFLVPDSVPGGRAIAHQASLIINLARKKEDVTDEGMGLHRAIYKLEKNKVGRPFVKGDFTFAPGSPINRGEEVVARLTRDGIIGEGRFEDDGTWTDKRGWQTIVLDEDNVQAIRDDQYADGVSEEELFNDRSISIYGPHAKRDGTPTLPEYLVQFPSLMGGLTDRIMDTLNDPMPVEDVEYDAEDEYETLSKEEQDEINRLSKIQQEAVESASADMPAISEDAPNWESGE